MKVKTLNGTVSLSGLAQSGAENARAESRARSTKGARQVLNNLAVRP